MSDHLVGSSPTTPTILLGSTMKLKELFENTIHLDSPDALLCALVAIEKEIEDELEYPEDSIEFWLEHPRMGKVYIHIGNTQTKKGYELEIMLGTGSGSSNYFSVVSIIKELRIRY